MNQRNIDEDHYLSEDGFTCFKGRTHTYILTMDTLNIYGPKSYKFGDFDKNYYFLEKINAEGYRKELLTYYRRLKMKINKLPKTKKGYLRRKDRLLLPSKPEFTKSYRY